MKLQNAQKNFDFFSKNHIFVHELFPDLDDLHCTNKIEDDGPWSSFPSNHATSFGKNETKVIAKFHFYLIFFLRFRTWNFRIWQKPGRNLKPDLARRAPPSGGRRTAYAHSAGPRFEENVLLREYVDGSIYNPSLFHPQMVPKLPKSIAN